MAGLSDYQKRCLLGLRPHLCSVVDFINKELKVGDAMPSAKLFENLKLSGDLGEFKVGFSVAVSSGVITGMKSAKRSGFRRIETGVEVNGKTLEAVVNGQGKKGSPVADSRIPPDVQGTVIQLTQTIRLRAGKYNWIYQKLSGGNWVGQRYWPDLPTALKRSAQVLLEQGIRASNTFVKSTDDLVRMVNDAEGRITDLLEGKEQELDEAPDDEEEEAA